LKKNKDRTPIYILLIKEKGLHVYHITNLISDKKRMYSRYMSPNITEIESREKGQSN
jgi:hypothetical protein